MCFKITSLERKLKKFKGLKDTSKMIGIKHNHIWYPYVFRHHHKHKLEHAMWGNKLVVH